MKENFRRFKKERESKKKVYYDPNGMVGGALHICLNDLNLNDDDIVQCLENTIPKIENPY